MKTIIERFRESGFPTKRGLYDPDRQAFELLDVKAAGAAIPTHKVDHAGGKGGV